MDLLHVIDGDKSLFLKKYFKTFIFKKKKKKKIKKKNTFLRVFYCVLVVKMC